MKSITESITGRMDTLKLKEVVAGVFLDEVSARDAIAELKIAGFRSEQVGACLSEEGKQAHKALPTDVDGKHSLVWRLRHSFERDLHLRGAEMFSGEDAAGAEGREWSCTELDMKETLRNWGVAEDTIHLLNREVTPAGVLILVHAGIRREEAAVILERNRGIIRTAMATQAAHGITKTAT